MASFEANCAAVTRFFLFCSAVKYLLRVGLFSYNTSPSFVQKRFRDIFVKIYVRMVDLFEEIGYSYRRRGENCRATPFGDLFLNDPVFFYALRRNCEMESISLSENSLCGPSTIAAGSAGGKISPYILF